MNLDVNVLKFDPKKTEARQSFNSMENEEIDHIVSHINIDRVVIEKAKKKHHKKLWI